MGYDGDDRHGTMPTGELEDVAPPPKRRTGMWAVSAGLVIVVAAAAIVGVVVTSHSKTKSPLVVLSAASARTTSSGTAQILSLETLTIGGQTVTPIHIEGSQDFTLKKGSLTVYDSSSKPIETIRSAGGVTYVSTPLPGVPLPGGAHWVSINPADVKADASAAQSLGSQDPSSGLQFMSAIEGNPVVLDHDPLDGANVTHYAFTLNLDSFLKRMATVSKDNGLPAFGAALEKLGSLVDLTKVPAEARIDSDGRVRQFTMTIAITKDGETLKDVDVTSFSNFGEPVTVETPAASDSVPLKQAPHFLTDLEQSIEKSQTPA